MHRLDWLKISLLAGLTGCGTNLDEGEADGQTTTTMGSGAETGEDTQTSVGTETGEDDVCELGCEGAVVLAEGIVQCPDGKFNRVGVGTFDPTIAAPACEGTEVNMNCTTDAECNVEGFGKCIHGETTLEDGTTQTYCGCVYSCATDSDCSESRVCLPPGVVEGTPPWPTCYPAGCATGSDCGECGECGIGVLHDGCEWLHAIECRTAQDLCSNDAECEGVEVCAPFWADYWFCQSGGCAIGRPLLVGAVANTAPSQRRSDWTQMPSRLPEDAELAGWWAEVAALEHASVASFARFGAQLMALGAPPELVRASKRAALDEIEHARLAYGLASAYGGQPVGPGQLNLDGVTMKASWREVVRCLIEEACVGETLGVAEAMAAVEVARVPSVRMVLDRIAADELRHAQLAWRALAWLLREADEVDRKWANSLLADAIRSVGRSVTDGPHRPAEGVLGGRARAQVHRDARSRVLVPLARAVGCDRLP